MLISDTQKIAYITVSAMHYGKIAAIYHCIGTVYAAGVSDKRPQDASQEDVPD